MDIGERLRTARKAAGLTQEGVARRAGLTLKAVGEVERGEVQDPHYSTLAAIADALGTTVAELVGEQPAFPKASPPPETGQQAKLAPEAMPGPSGHAHQVGIHEGEKGTEVTYSKTSFFEIMRNALLVELAQDVRSGRLSEEDAWERFQQEAG